MKRKKVSHPTKSIKLALFFGLLILFLIVSVLGIKFIFLLTKSKFDGKHEFLLQVISPRSTQIVGFNPDTSSITLAQLPSTRSARELGIPVDATIFWEDVSDPKELTKQMLLHSTKVSTLTPMDIVKLFIFSHTVSDAAITKDIFSFPLDNKSLEMVNKIFVDKTIYQEGQTVEIINAADTLGLGNAAASVLGHVGVNVISVATASQDHQASEIDYTGNKTYTVRRLMNLFHMPAVHTSSQQVSDIVIILGKDSEGLFQ